MPATQLDITIEKGTDYQQDFPITDPSITTAELTGATAAMQVRTSADDPTALVTLTTANGGLTINPTGRKISASISWGTTVTLPPGVDRYDIKLRTASGRYVRTHEGAATVNAEITTVQPPPPSPAPAPGPTPAAYTDADGDPYTTAEGDPYTESL